MMIIKNDRYAEYALKSFDAVRTQISLVVDSYNKISNIADDFEGVDCFTVLDTETNEVKDYFGYTDFVSVTKLDNGILIIIERGDG